MKANASHEYEPGQRVAFRVFQEIGKPIRRGGLVMGPDPEHAGQMEVRGDPTPEDIAADRPGEIFSVWFAQGGLVSGAKAPTQKAAKATADQDPEGFIIVHRGPHTEQVTEILSHIFGPAAGAAIGSRPLHRTDGTCVYAFSASPQDLPAINAKIEADRHGAPLLAVTDPSEAEIDLLDEMNSDRDWPFLAAV